MSIEDSSNHYEVGVLPSDEFESLLHRVGNHEGKTAVAAILVSQPDTYFKPGALRRKVTSLQEEESAWIPQRQVLERYCSKSLKPAGIVDLYTGGYRATRQFLPQRLAFIGSVLRWSLDFPDISVQKLLGSSITKSEYTYRPPNLRYDICKIIMNNDGHEMSYADVHYLIDDETISTYAAREVISVLSNQGILEAHTLDVTVDTKLEIMDPSFHQGRQSYEELKESTQLVYRALGSLWDKGMSVIGFKDLREQALALDRDADIVALRRHWVTAGSQRSKSKGFPGLRRIGRAIKDSHKTSNVRLHPEHAEAVSAFVTRLDSIQNNPDAVVYEEQSALSILANEKAMTEIFRKAQRFSAHYAKSQEGSNETAERIIAILQRTGRTNVKRVVAELKAGDRPLASKVVYRYLHRLVEEGRIIEESVPESPDSKRRTKHYHVVQEDDG